MSYDFAFEHRYALLRHGIYAGFALWVGLFAPIHLSAQDPGYRVTIAGVGPTTIHGFQESLALEPLIQTETNDRNSVRPYAVDVSPDGQTVAVVTEDNHQFLLLDRATLRIQRRLSLSGAGMDVMFHPDGSTVYALSEAPWGRPSQLFIYNLVENQWRFMDLPRFSQPGDLILSPDQSTVIVRNSANLYFIDPNAATVNQLTLLTSTRDWVFTQDGRTMYVSNFGTSTHMPGTTVTKIDLATQTVVAEITVKKNPGAMALSPDGRWLAVATFDTYGTTRVTGLVMYIDTHTDEVLSRPYRANSFIEELQWLPGNQMMVYHGDSFGHLSLRLHDLAGGPLWIADSATFIGANASWRLFKQALFNPADNMIYARFQDAVIGFNRLKSNQALRFPIDQLTTGMALSPDGEHLILTSSSTSKDEDNLVMSLPTNKFKQVQQHHFDYRLHASYVNNQDQTLLFTESGKRFYWVEADALCQLSEQPMSSYLTKVYRTRDENRIIGLDSVQVSFFDNLTGQKLRDVRVGRSPKDMVVTPNEQFVLVPNSSSDTVSLIDAASQNLVSHIPVGDSPRALVANDSFAYVLNYSGRSLSVIDIQAASVVSTIPFSYRPSMIQMTPDGETLLVLHYSDGRVSAIDVATEQVRQEFTVPTRVTLFQLNPAGDRLFLGVTSPREVQLFAQSETTGEWSLIQEHSLDISASLVSFTPNGERVYVGVDLGRNGDGELHIYDGRNFNALAKFPTVPAPKYIHFSEASASGGEALAIADPILKGHLVALYDLDCNEELSLAEVEHVTAVEFPADPESADRVTNLAGLEAFPNLERVVLTNHGITEVGSLPVGLVELNLSGNQLLEVGSLPEGLRILDLSRNPLASINALPSTLIAALFSHTELTALPAIPEALRILVLTNSQNAVLPTAQLSNLWWLGLSDWDQSQMPQDLQLDALRYLDLVNNRFGLVPDVAAMPRLIYLDLSQNPLSDGVCDQITDLANQRPNLDIAIGNLTDDGPRCNASKHFKQRPNLAVLLQQIRNGGSL
ncbi:beta-propeller fold lactonase family protein [Acanthopleuribacter pedis]|uniref:Beta-propeller fold lactonase family protein n=1 Tax=Acanthopleuribacter pedis TaxID=442870 RepID=A0A8J7QRT5_9BACT|nr:beta-propeller fold lactonase family protein [Acanthopleuribacter pedis]MBO1323405.1 beta-propeller fold lactonase family protein [Acanthopleuribacter pedis]